MNSLTQGAHERLTHIHDPWAHGFPVAQVLWSEVVPDDEVRVGESLLVVQDGQQVGNQVMLQPSGVVA